MSLLSRRAFATGLAAAALPLPFVRRAAAAPKSLTVASLMADDKPETKIWLKIRDLVEERLPGRFAFRIVGNAALGGEKEVAEGLRLGSIQATVTTVSALAAWVPETQILDLPFVFADRAHARRAVAGKRIRVIQSPLHVELWKAYGALPTPLPITETWNALKSGVVDMMDLTKSAYAGFKLYEVVPVLVETAHIRATGVVHLAASFWAGLSDEEKRVFTDAAREGALHFDDLIEADEAASMRVAFAAGGRMVPAENRDAWVDGARTVWAALAPKLGGLDRIEALARA
jgi:TRAP-type C4-dicarboxylate transport system substrate-binding protein